MARLPLAAPRIVSSLECFYIMTVPPTDRTTPWREQPWIQHSQVLLDSYHHWLGTDLIARDGTAEAQAERLFEAPRVVVSHGTQADPILNYGNRCALDLWKLDAASLLAMPSRLTAEPMHRDERAQLLARTTRDGYVDDYQGIRITSQGRRFRIEQAIVWNLLDATGQYVGQAATFDRWQWLE